MSTVGELVISQAAVEDTAQILAIQRLAFTREAAIYDDYSIPPLTETVEQLEAAFNDHIILKAEIDGVIVGAVRGHVKANICHIGRLVVHPDYQRRGIGKKLMTAVEAWSGAERFELFTGELSIVNLHLYASLGYQVVTRRAQSPKVTLVYMEKTRAALPVEVGSQ